MSGQAGVPRVSVVIPTYNHAHLLGRALVSALTQTFQDVEVIVVDDASEDGTAEVIARLGDPRLRLLRRSRHEGAARAWNAAIAEARGEWIAFLDSDDEWLPEKLARQLACARNAASVIYCRYYRQNTDGARALLPTRPLAEGDVLDELLARTAVPTTSGYVVRRCALLEVGGFDETLASGQDYNLLLKLASVSHRFAAVQEPLFIKHNHSGRQIRTDAIAKLTGARAIDRHWGPVVRERLGVDAYERWRAERLRKVWKVQRRHVKQLIRSGARRQAWRYGVRMLPYLPWSARLVAKAAAFALLGGRVRPRGVGEPPREQDRNRALGPGWRR